MGGCASKPKVAKEGEQPEPEQEYELVNEDIVETKQEPPSQEQRGVNVKNVDQVVDDDQANTRRSLSLLFNKENEDAQVTTENEKTKDEETAKHETFEDKKTLEDAKSNEPTVKHESPKKEEAAKHETFEDKKTLEDAKSNEPTVKHESPKKEEKLYQESKVNEPAEEQEPAVVVEEVFSLQNQSTDPAKDSVKREIPEVAKKTSEETITIEPAKVIVVEQNQNTNAAENEDAKVSTENEKTKAEETVKQETFEEKKLLEGAKISEPTVKQESPKTVEKLSQETKSNGAATKQEPLEVARIIEPTVKQESPKTELSQETKINEPDTKQESAVVAIEEKPTLLNQIIDSVADVIGKKETPEEAKINEPVVQEIAEKQNQNDVPPKVTAIKTETPNAEKVSEKTQSNNELNEPIKQEISSETNPIEAVVVSPLNEKVIEVLLPNEELGENKAVEGASIIGEKSNVDTLVEHTPKASDVGSDKVSLS